MVHQLFKKSVNGKEFTQHTSAARAVARAADVADSFQNLLSKREGLINVESGLYAVENTLWRESKIDDAPLPEHYKKTYVEVKIATAEELGKMIENEEFSIEVMVNYLIANHFNSSESKWASNAEEALPLPKNWEFNTKNLCYISNEGVTLSYKFAARAAEMFDENLDEELSQLIKEMGDFLKSKL